MAVVLFVVDQLTKIWAVAALSDGSISVFGDFFALRVTRNPGASFSTFQSAGSLLGVVALVMAVVIVVALGSTTRKAEAIALGAVLGGALGNFVDRVFRGDGFLDGGVIDFLDFSFWPTFNVADSAISLGVIALLVIAVFAGPEREAFDRADELD